MAEHGGYPLPEELARHSRGARFASEEVRGVCRSAGEGLGREDAGEARFRSAAEMVELWRGLDLPAWVAPYALRDARLGYLNGYERTLVSGGLPEERDRARRPGALGRRVGAETGGCPPEGGRRMTAEEGVLPSP